MTVALSIPQALQEVALLLTRPVVTGQNSDTEPAGPLGMATLVAPGLAITPMEVPIGLEPLLASQIQGGSPVGASVLEVLQDLGLVLLELDSDLPMPAGEPALLGAADVHPRSEWYSAFATPAAPGGWLSHGTLGSGEPSFGDRRYLTLHLSEGPERTMGIPGAPVMSSESVVGSLAHERLQLEQWEREYLKRLFPLIPTPRATKRLVNVYRLLRAITTGEQRQALLGDERRGGYRAVLLLLAMVTAFPAEATAIIRGLLEGQGSASPPDDWWTFVADFRAAIEGAVQMEKPVRRQKGTPTKQARQPEASGLEDRDEDGADRWDPFFEKLGRVRPETEDFSCSEMAHWAPLVARYSFASGRLLLESD